MSIVLNKRIIPAIVEAAKIKGLITPETSPTFALYLISRYWRELFQRATAYPADALPGWSEKEHTAAKVIISALLYLHMEGCGDVEKLLEDSVKEFIKGQGRNKI